MKIIKKDSWKGAQTLQGFSTNACGCSATCRTCSDCRSSSQVASLRDSASANSKTNVDFVSKNNTNG